MANVTGKRADKRTEEQRRNDAAQNARPKGTQDTAYVTTGPATGKEDERAVGTESKSNCATSQRRQVPRDSWGLYFDCGITAAVL